MKKSLLLGMLLCGATVSFAQQPKDNLNNSEIVKKQASSLSEFKRDSIVVDGFVTTVYEYAEDGSYTKTEYSRDNEGKITSKLIASYDNKGRQVGSMSYLVEGDEYVPFIGNKLILDSEGNVVSDEFYSRAFQGKFGLSSTSDYRIDVETNNTIQIQKNYNIDGDVTSIYEFTFDTQKRQLGYVNINVVNGKEIPSSKYECKYSENGNLTENASYQWVDGEWVATNKNVFAFNDNGNKESYKGYEFKNGEYVLNRYILYDEKGNPTEQFDDNVKTIFKNVYAEDGLLKEKIGSKVEGKVETPVCKSLYTYFTMEGGSYYYRSDNSSSDDGGKTWKEAGFEYFVPGSEDGYAELSVFGVNGYRSCFSYSIKENDILKSRGIYTIINDKLVCVELVKFTYNEYNDLVREEYYENPKYAEGGSLELVKTTNYEYDQNTQSPVFMAKETHFNIIDFYTTDANGKELSRTTYYYSEYKPSTTTGITSVAVSADNEQAIYNLSGQRVNATQKGQIYIQNGKKFMAK